MDKLQAKTIQDFGDQWSQYSSNDGFYGSQELFADILAPLLKVADLKDKSVAEIGSGTGRIVNMLLGAGVKHCIAVEPSEAYSILQENLRNVDNGAERVTVLHMTGDKFAPAPPIEFVFSIGVLQFILNPLPVVKAVFDGLSPGGSFFSWVYSKEGNRIYIAFVTGLRIVTTRIPSIVLHVFVEVIYWMLCFYRLLTKVIPLPLKHYLHNILWPMTPQKRRLVIHDQLKPSYVKFYTRDGIESLMRSAGFEEVKVHHRHGYGWSVLAEKPTTDAKAS